jgi:hypothetical protein
MVAFFWTLATALVLGIAAFKISGKAAALLALAFYMSFTAILYSSMLAANSEILMALPYSLAALLMWLAIAKKNGFYYFLSGAAAGLACLMKQVGGVEAAAALAFFLLIPFVWNKATIRFSLKAGALFGTGFILPIAATALLFYKQGVLKDAIFWCIIYPTRHINRGDASLNFMSQIFIEFIPFVLSSIILWILCCLWIKRAAQDSNPAKERSLFTLFLLLWLIASIIAAMLGKRMLGHYFIQILPPLCILAALGGARYFSEGGCIAKRWRIGIIALTIIPALVFFFITLFSKPTTNTWNEPKQDFHAATEYINTHTKPEDRIFVWGWFPPVYVYSERTPATRFVLTTMFTGYKSGGEQNEKDRSDITWALAPEAWPMLRSDFDRNKPELIVDTAPGDYHDFARYPIKGYSIVRDYIEKHCQLEKQISGMDIYRCSRINSNSASSLGP